MRIAPDARCHPALPFQIMPRGPPDGCDMGEGSVLIPNQDRSEAGLFEEGHAGLFKRVAVHLPELQQVLRRYDVGVQASSFRAHF